MRLVEIVRHAEGVASRFVSQPSQPEAESRAERGTARAVAESAARGALGRDSLTEQLRGSLRLTSIPSGIPGNLGTPSRAPWSPPTRYRCRRRLAPSYQTSLGRDDAGRCRLPSAPHPNPCSSNRATCPSRCRTRLRLAVTSPGPLLPPRSSPPGSAQAETATATGSPRPLKRRSGLGCGAPATRLGTGTGTQAAIRT